MYIEAITKIQHDWSIFELIMFVACKNDKTKNKYIVTIEFHPKFSFVMETVCNHKP